MSTITKFMPIKMELKQVATVMATNKPFTIDSALHSRFQRQFLIPFPSLESRRSALEHKFNDYANKDGRRHSLTFAHFHDAAHLLDGYSMRDIDKIVDTVFEPEWYTATLSKTQIIALPNLFQSGSRTPQDLDRDYSTRLNSYNKKIRYFF
jgi:AAA+ superfamily predicted ATPase